MTVGIKLLIAAVIEGNIKIFASVVSGDMNNISPPLSLCYHKSGDYLFEVIVCKFYFGILVKINLRIDITLKIRTGNAVKSLAAHTLSHSDVAQNIGLKGISAYFYSIRQAKGFRPA